MCTAWDGRLSKRFCKHFSESCTGFWASSAAAMLPKQSKGTLRKKFTNLLLNLPPHAVVFEANFCGLTRL